MFLRLGARPQCADVSDLGCCRYKTQKFNSVASQTSGSLLLLAAISILIPTAAQQLGTGGGPAESALNALVGDPMPLDKVSAGCRGGLQLCTAQQQELVMDRS